MIPTVSLQIAPGANATDQMPAWSEVGDRMRVSTHKRGRQYETDTVPAGTASFELNSSDRVLDPSYTKGPFYGRLTPHMQIRLIATVSGTAYPLFRGFVERWPIRYDGPNAGIVTLDCVDRGSVLANAVVSGTFPEQLSGARITSILSAGGWITSTVPSGWILGTSALGSTTILGVAVPTGVIDAGEETVAAITIDSASPVNALTHIQEVARFEPGVFFFDGQGRAVFRDRSRITPTPSASVLTFTDDATAADATHVYYMAPFDSTYDIDRVFNDFELTAEDGSLTSLVDPGSVDTYDRRTLSGSTHLRSNNSDLRQLAGYFRWTMKDARLRFETVTVPLTTTLAFQAMLPREIGEVVTVARTPVGSSVTETITQLSVIESIQMDLTPDFCSATLQLSPLPPATTPWVLGTSTLGVNNQLVYA